VLAATECSGICFCVLDDRVPLNGSRVPVGYPFEGTEVLIVDEGGKTLGPGEAGEIVVRSRMLAPGYWRDPEQTAAAFQPDPEGPEVRRYRTGDLGLLRPDGCLEHLGRRDHQVKVRGHRVEPAEVERALLNLGCFQDAVVVGRGARHDSQQLVAYVVGRPGPASSVGGLRKALRENFPDYMIPSAFVRLDTLPLTPNGKVDRQALPAPEAARPALDNDYQPPEDVIEQQLTEVWEDCLNVRPIGAADNFFELGGDSLLALEMLARVEELFGKTVAPETLLGGATLRHLARALLQQAERQTPGPLIEVQGGGSGRRFFFLHGNWYGGGLYCVNLARHLGPKQPFYALQPHGEFGARVPPTIEEMAADHVRTLLAFQRRGPFLLGGYCNGGLVALEMAHQLFRRGHRLDRVIAIAPPPGIRFGAALLEPPALPPSSALEVPGVKTMDWYYKLGAAYREACARYLVRPFPGRLIVFQPLDDAPDRQAVQGWKAAARWVEIDFVPGNHFTVLTTHIATLADRLRHSLGT
jgi:thioesterase domain-containing protein/acyl carrier protein